VRRGDRQPFNASVTYPKVALGLTTATWSVEHAEQAPRPGYALQLVLAAVVELDA
jgi:hypothetical protein